MEILHAHSFQSHLLEYVLARDLLSCSVRSCVHKTNPGSMQLSASIQGDHGSPPLAGRAAAEAVRDPWQQFSRALDPNVLARL